MKNEKNENIALLVGFVLIIFVIIFTVIRNKSFWGSDDSQSSTESEISTKDTAPAYTTISATDLNKKIMLANKQESFQLLDVRPFEAYANEHILDVINVPLDEFPVAQKVDTRSLVVVIGENSEDKNIDTAVTKLKEEKIENIKVLAGGMESWKQLIGALVTYGNPKSFVDQSKVSYLDPESLNESIKQKVPVYIVDVRTPDEYTKGHIEGAINLPFEELEKRRFEVKEKRVVIIGANELQEFQAAVQLYDMLLISPFVMRGAMPAWETKGFPLVK